MTGDGRVLPCPKPHEWSEWREAGHLGRAYQGQDSRFCHWCFEREWREKAPARVRPE